MKLVVLITLLCILIDTHALPNGAPKKACLSLMPAHSGIAAQQDPSPFSVSVVKSGSKFEVTITSAVGEEFEGFMLQARSSSNPSTLVDGKFTTSQLSKAVDCNEGTKNTLTHVNASPKKEVKTEWTPKETVNGDIIFRATVAKTFALFWTQVDSQPVKMDASMTVSLKNLDRHPAYDVCSNKPCFTLPNECIQSQDCKVIFSWSKSSADNILFELHGSLDSSQYMAMALSDDDRMGADSVVECIKDGDNVIARESWNEGKSNTRTKELPRESYNVSVTDSMTSCSWKKPYVFESNGITYDLTTENYYVLLAFGGVTSGSLQYHSSRIYTKNAVNFTVDGSVEGESDTGSLYKHDDEATEIHSQPTEEKSTGQREADSTYKTTPSEGSETVTPSCGSQFSFSVFLLTIFGLFYVTERYLFGVLA